MNEMPILQLVLTKGVGEATIRKIYKYSVIKQLSLNEIINNSINIWAKDLKIDIEIACMIANMKDQAKKLNDELLKNQISVCWLGDQLYPEKLKNILKDDSPTYLFYKGNPGLLKELSVGFCGSRKSSEKGIQITMNSAKIFACENICVVSGYAYGVDFAAHKASIQANGNTIIVLSEGILKFKNKKEISSLFNSRNYLVISQFPPQLNWIARNAMKRNITIIGLSNAMILVESGKTGGTYSAGIDTLRYERPLFVIDYAFPEEGAEGNPYFLARGGIPIRGSSVNRMPNLTRVIETIKTSTIDKTEKQMSLFK